MFGSTIVVVVGPVVVVAGLLGSTVVVVTAGAVVVEVGMVVVVPVVGTDTVVVVVGGTSPAIRGAGGVDTGGAGAFGIGVSGTDGKRSAKVVGRQAAWAGATATRDTKRAQAKKSVIARVLKVPLKLPAREGPARLKRTLPRPIPGHASGPREPGPITPFSGAGPSLLPGSRRSPSNRSRWSERGLIRGRGQSRASSRREGSRSRRLRL